MTEKKYRALAAKDPVRAVHLDLEGACPYNNPADCPREAEVSRVLDAYRNRQRVQWQGLGRFMQCARIGCVYGEWESLAVDRGWRDIGYGQWLYPSRTKKDTNT